MLTRYGRFLMLLGTLWFLFIVLGVFSFGVVTVLWSCGVMSDSSANLLLGVGFGCFLVYTGIMLFFMYVQGVINGVI